MVNLPHSPATISTANLARARQTAKPVEDIITARVVGFNPKAKEVLAQDGGGNTYSVFPNSGRSSVMVGQSVILSRSRSQSGERTIRLISIVPLGKRPSDVLGQIPNQGNINELCKPTALAGSSFPKEPPEEPSSPDSQNSPTSNPDPVEPIEDPPSEPPTGCQPTDSSQWFNGAECPAGTDNLGFIEMPDGSTMSLCESPSGNTPSGDGCPETPDLYGWTCSSTGCVFVANGSFVTQEECEAACVEPEQEDESEDPPLPEPVDPPFEGGQCVGVLYTWSADWEVTLDNGSKPSGTTTKTDVPGPLSNIKVDKSIDNPTRRVDRFWTDNNGSQSEPNVYVSPFGRTVESVTTSNIQITRQDGLPDDCGDPEP